MQGVLINAYIISCFYQIYMYVLLSVYVWKSRVQPYFSVPVIFHTLGCEDADPMLLVGKQTSAVMENTENAPQNMKIHLPLMQKLTAVSLHDQIRLQHQDLLVQVRLTGQADLWLHPRYHNCLQDQSQQHEMVPYLGLKEVLHVLQ